MQMGSADTRGGSLEKRVNIASGNKRDSQNNMFDDK